jgi:hypothetical protein
MPEKEMDVLIEAKYSPLWTHTDKEPWGDQSHPKWKQNVASAKSALDRKGIVVRFVARSMKGRRRTVFRVLLADPIFTAARAQWETRKVKGRRRKIYDPLEQPAPVYAVPPID